jgi:vanillate O-demethylase monooxygenase subunit
MNGVDPPPSFQMILGTTDPIDRWQIASWVVPSTNITTTGAKLAGQSKEEGLVGHVLHLLTPETAGSTHYFWSFCRNFRQQDDALSAGLAESVSRTFDEDRHLLELQQKEVGVDGELRMRVALQVDDGPLRARRIIAARVRRETAGDPEILAPAIPLEGSEPRLANE